MALFHKFLSAYFTASVHVIDLSVNLLFVTIKEVKNTPEYATHKPKAAIIIPRINNIPELVDHQAVKIIIPNAIITTHKDTTPNTESK
jgi:hypothetical protein